MLEPGPSSHATALPSVPRRALVIIIGLLLAAHSVLITIWVQPPNPFRDAIGQGNLAAYINNPVMSFEQSWSVFAPTPRRGGENVLIRAHLGTPGTHDSRVTGWFDITHDEDRRIVFLANPSRIHSATRRLGGSLNAAFAKMNGDQRAAVAANSIATSRSDLAAALRKAGTGGDAGRDVIRSYLVNEEMLIRFGSMYAVARWGTKVTAVEFRVGHRTVPPFIRRNDTDFVDVPFVYNAIGIRQRVGASEEAQRAFDRYVVGAPDATASHGSSSR